MKVKLNEVKKGCEIKGGISGNATILILEIMLKAFLLLFGFFVILIANIVFFTCVVIDTFTFI